MKRNILSRLVCARWRCAVREYRGWLPTVVGVLCGLLWVSPRLGAQSLPTDVNASCTLTPSQFAGWFVKGVVTPGGVVNPASSVTFVASSNCAFYQWSEQMFLWLTSPAPVEYGGGAEIFDSPTFFDVSPPDSSGKRTFIRHTLNVIRPFPLPIRGAQVGPDGLQILVDTAGRLVEVAPAKVSASGKQLILNSAGKEVEIDHATVENGKVNFVDTAGKAITGAKPILQKRLLEKVQRAPERAALAGTVALPEKTVPFLVGQKFMIGGIPIIIDPFGNVDPVEQGQAGTGAVLETQNNSLVYYTIAVNDVYAYFLTGIQTNKIPSNPATLTFPITQAELTSIVNFAQTKGVTFPDPDALAVEVKASWVEASTLPGNGAGYITMNASIPNYTPNANNTLWTATNTSRTATLALVGMHVVGTVAGHPEMVWATFERSGNTPLATYTYNGSSGVETVNQSTAGTWLFSATNAGAPFNAEHMAVSGANIQALAANPPPTPPPFTISPSNTLRWKPFGAATNLIPLNPTVGSATDANTDIISINNSVRGMLAGGDIRGNYIFSGATWTFGGAAPTFNFTSPNQSNQVGTSFLTNSTMETYDQGNDTTSNNGAMNCFTCHNDNGNSNPLSPNVVDGLSHIYAVLQSLP